MNIEGERDLFIRYGTFKDLYKYERSDGTCFYVNRDGQERLKSERDILIHHGTFKDLYKFRRSDGTCFYVSRKGIRARLMNLKNWEKPHDQTKKALELHP